jgi:hypothetical protein
MLTQIKLKTSAWHRRETRAQQSKFLIEELQTTGNQAGSCIPQRANFRLTPGVKGKFTERLRSDPKESCRRRSVQIVRSEEAQRKRTWERRRSVGFSSKHKK